MATKIYVSQIDTANTTGGQADIGSVILVGSQGAYWSNNAVLDILGKPLSELTGYTGSVGFKGSSGDSGYFGSTGFTGSVGPDGAFGVAGYQGSLGSTGFTGSVGFLGSAGYQGSEGYKGSEGYRGSEGFQGSAGVGYQGSTGFRGSIGATGFQGSVGQTGTIAFLGLTDTPASYSGAGNYFLRVNSSATGIIFDSGAYITNSVGTGINFSSNTAYNPTFQNYSEVINVKGNSGPIVVIDPIYGNLVTVTLDADIVEVVMGTNGLPTDKAFSITLALKQDAIGSRTVDWSNQTIYWPAGEGIYSPDGPTLTTTANYTDFVTLMTFNGGAYWYGLMSAKGFPTP